MVSRLLLWFLLCQTTSVQGQHEWGVAVGAHASYFFFNVPKDDYWTEGAADGSGGVSLALQYNGSDTAGPNWKTFELHYAERRAEVLSVYAYKVGTATTSYAVDYGTLSLGYLPRFPLFNGRRWWIASGIRCGLPVRVSGAGYEEITGGLAGPPNYYEYTTFSDRSDFASVLGFDLRLVFALEQVLHVGNRQLLAIGAGMDLGPGSQRVYGGANISNSDIFLRVSYKIQGSGRSSVQ